MEASLTELPDCQKDNHLDRKSTASANEGSDTTTINSTLIADVHDSADESDMSVMDAFFEHMTLRLEDAGELEFSERAAYEDIVSGKAVRVDGSSGPPRDSDGVLSLLVCDFYQDAQPVTINAQHARRLFGQVTNFITACRDSSFRERLKSSRTVAALANIISDEWQSLAKVKLVLVTNAIYSARTDSVPAGEIQGVPITYNIWDLSRYQKYEISGQAREDLVVNFQSEFGGAIPALLASKKGTELESYLLVVPGSQLANIYEKWGARLLEANVRSFLQARGKVNQGIRDSIKREPSMFFAYNNGLSATADDVEVVQTGTGLMLISAKNLQIVNGGQTTASLHAAKRSFQIALDDVRVQMKLTVVPAIRSEEVVPRISQFANSQNKVNAADFFSNHPFHIRMEEYSRRLFVSSSMTANRDAKWFYERARGQYLVMRAKCSDADRRKFDKEFPKSQLFGKTDLAKAYFTFQMRPESVSRGAQKNFAEFSKEIGEIWSRADTKFDEIWFKQSVAKLITLRHLEKLITRQEWYPGGYRANIVTYGIAKLTADAEQSKLAINLNRIWKDQSISKELEFCLLTAAKGAAEILTNPASGIKNITEWAKKQACWDQLRCVSLDYGGMFEQALVDQSEALEAEKEDRREVAVVSGIEAQSRVVTAGGAYWAHLRAWCSGNEGFGHKEDGILKACSAVPTRIPTEKQCLSALAILSTARTAGYHDPNEATKIKIGSWSRHY